MKKSEYALFGGLTAASAAVALLGEPVGFAGLALFGGGGVAYWLLSRPPRGTAPGWPGHGTVPAAGRHTVHTAGLVFRVPRAGMAAAAGGAACFVAGGGALFVAGLRLEPGARLAQWPRGAVLAAAVICVVVFGGFLLAALPGAVRPARLALLPEGVHCRTPTGAGWLPWPALAEVTLGRRFGNPELRLLAGQPAQLRCSGLDRWLRAVRRQRGADLAAVVRGRTHRVAAAALADAARQTLEYYRDHPPARAGLADPATAGRWAVAEQQLGPGSYG